MYLLYNKTKQKSINLQISALYMENRGSKIKIAVLHGSHLDSLKAQCRADVQ